jgi:hypothetical protein
MMIDIGMNQRLPLKCQKHQIFRKQDPTEHKNTQARCDWKKNCGDGSANAAKMSHSQKHTRG